MSAVQEVEKLLSKMSSVEKAELLHLILVNAWAYVSLNKDGIDRQIQENEAA